MYFLVDMCDMNIRRHELWIARLKQTLRLGEYVICCAYASRTMLCRTAPSLLEESQSNDRKMPKAAEKSLVSLLTQRTERLVTDHW